MSDYISREKLKQAFSEDAINTLSCYDSSLMDLIRLEIDEIESENVKPVVYGKWGHLGADEWLCTACGHVITTEGSWEKPEKKYCEECGADMRDEQKYISQNKQSKQRRVEKR